MTLRDDFLPSKHILSILKIFESSIKKVINHQNNQWKQLIFYHRETFPAIISSVNVFILSDQITYTHPCGATFVNCENISSIFVCVFVSFVINDQNLNF